MFKLKCIKIKKKKPFKKENGKTWEEYNMLMMVWRKTKKKWKDEKVNSEKKNWKNKAR